MYMILRQLLPYSFSERLEVIKYRIGKILLRNSNKEVRICYHLTSKLIHQGIKIKKNGLNIAFEYPINNTNVKLELKRISSDIHVFQQIIVQEEYLNIINLIKNNYESCNVMIDAGANIGLTSLYFKSFFPNINIIALEPLDQTFLRLERNVEINNFKNITLIKKGLWSHSTKLKGDYSFRDGQDWSFRLVDALPNENALFEVCSVPDIIKEYKLDIIDFLKIDIEGSEIELFKNSLDLSWLNKVKIIGIEIHNEFNCRETIEQILINYNFSLSYSRELTIAINNDLIN